MNKIYNSLGNRIAITLIIFTIIIAVFIAWLGYTINERLEVTLWRTALETEYSYYLWNRKVNKYNYKTIMPPTTANLRTFIWYKDETQPESIPTKIKTMLPGIHDEIKINDREYSVLVKEVDGDRIYMSYDITRLEENEKKLSLMIAFIILSTIAIIIFISLVLSRNLVKSVKDLAERVNRLNPAERGSTLGKRYNEKEVTTIATAIESYLERMDGFMDREKDFLDTASHELRTPIAIISGATEVLKANSELPENINTTLSRLQHAAHDMNEIVNALFYLAKDTTHIESQSKIIDIQVFVEKAIRNLKHLADEKSISIKTSLTKTELPVHAGMVAIVINNLLRNAIEHTEKGSIHISLELGMLTVVNTSCIIDPQEQSKLFQKRVRGSGSQKGEGSGLGLYIIERICTRLHWKLTLYSDELDGTTVCVDLGNLEVPISVY